MSAPVQDPPANGTAESVAIERFDLRQPIGSPKQLRRILGAYWKDVAPLLPKHFTEERFGALILSAAAKTPAVFNCTALSLLNTIHEAASMGLEINAATGEAYMVPYKGEVKLLPGYKGLVKLAIQSREVTAIEARLVYAGEYGRNFRVFYGTNSRIEHEPDFSIERNPETVEYVYAVAKLPAGGYTFEVMTLEQVVAIRDRKQKSKRNDGPDKTPWATDFEEMARKTPTRRLCKYLPLSPQLSRAIELVDAAETGEYEDITEPRAASSGSSKLNDAIKREAPKALNAAPMEVPPPRQGQREPVRHEAPREAPRTAPATQRAQPRAPQGPPTYIAGLLRRVKAGERLSGSDAEELRQWEMDNGEGRTNA